MKQTILYILCAIMLTIASCTDKKTEKQVPQPMDTIPMMVMQIQKCSKLYTAEYHVHKIVTHNDQVKLKGSFLQKQFDITLPVGNRKIAIPMNATIKGYIDFNGFSDKNVKRRGQEIEIILPDPKVELTSSKINHADIKKQVSLLRSNFSDEEMSIYERQGRAAIINDIPKMGIMEMVQENAANMLIPMIESLGYAPENITITFRKKFTVDDLPALLDPKSIAK
ncbi:MAG: DUF4230 domain-containing protein [Prevotellaceae bacterium]|nr:DUF4230 domain-containing protein [Prevotella sp.]MDD7258602.1 DUF4230 domain-containing protein [Prevotellaceae bacterium]MDY6130000.1 DUF4230 domain-containing protein [Prevotella sp.]